MKRYFGAPSRNSTETNTMLMDSVATKAGTAICWAPSRMAWRSLFPIARFRWMFSISTVASSTRMPTARAKPPSVMMLSVWPSARRARSAIRIDSGIDTVTISVLRQEPRKSRIISAVRAAATIPSTTTPLTARDTKVDWSVRSSISSPLGAEARSVGSSALTRFATSRVDASPFLSTVSSTERRPSRRTTLVWTAKPSWTWATSRTKTMLPPTRRMGMLLRASTASGLLLRLTVYSRGPILAVPVGRVRFWALTAALTSWAESPLASRAGGSRSTMIWRGAPP